MFFPVFAFLLFLFNDSAEAAVLFPLRLRWDCWERPPPCPHGHHSQLHLPQRRQTRQNLRPSQATQRRSSWQRPSPRRLPRPRHRPPGHRPPGHRPHSFASLASAAAASSGLASAAACGAWLRFASGQTYFRCCCRRRRLLRLPAAAYSSLAHSPWPLASMIVRAHAAKTRSCSCPS